VDAQHLLEHPDVMIQATGVSPALSGAPLTDRIGCKAAFRILARERRDGSTR
jgi:hypothetical protein